MHKIIRSLNRIYKLLNIIQPTVDCLQPITSNSKQVYELMLDAPFMDYNLMTGHIFIETDRENKTLLMELINNTNTKLIDDTIAMRNYMKQIMTEDVKYRIKNLEREYGFIGYNLITDFNNMDVYKIIEGDIITIFKSYFPHELDDYKIISDMKQFMRTFFDDFENLLRYYLGKENDKLLKINEEQMTDLLNQFLEILINTKLKSKTYDPLPIVIESNYDEVYVGIDNFLEAENKIIDEFIACKIRNPGEIKTLQKLCNLSIIKTKEKIHDLILRIFRKQLDETNVKGLLNNTFLIDSLSKQIEIYEFCKEEIFHHRINILLQKIERYDMRVYKIENSPSPER